jgi:probable rRNA maturation factor
MSSEGSSSSSGNQAELIFDPASRTALGRRVTQASLREFAEQVRTRVTRRRPFTCLITGDGELKRLNAQFRKRKYATDVLSFPSGEVRGPIGEIAISADRALAQAAEHGHGVGDEIRVLLLHGVLHLMGFDHETDRGEMARVEARWRKALGLPLSLTERAAE